MKASNINILTSPLDFAIAPSEVNKLEVIKEAINSNRIVLAFQPVMATKNPSHAAFYEGLARILDERDRPIAAGKFIPLIEETELGRKVDCIILEQGLEILAQKPDLRLSLNMSARSIGYAPWIATLNAGLLKNPLVAERLILEITETSAMHMPEIVISFMADLRKRGVSFALDDFGSGYTSFRYLRDFHFDVVKIDGQFIKGISQDIDNQILTGALVQICQQFDMLTVAEHVETAEDFEFLDHIGVDCVQGYYFARPSLEPNWTPEAKAEAM